MPDFWHALNPPTVVGLQQTCMIARGLGEDSDAVLVEIAFASEGGALSHMNAIRLSPTHQIQINRVGRGNGQQLDAIPTPGAQSSLEFAPVSTERLTASVLKGAVRFAVAHFSPVDCSKDGGDRRL